MKVLLINPIVRVESPPAYFPLGLASIAGALTSSGHDVQVLDINAARWSPEETENKIMSADFDLAGLTGLITEYNQIKWLANVIKSHHADKPIVLGGGLASSIPEIILEETQIDYVVIGEGEETVSELSAALSAAGSPDRVSGIAYKSGSGIHFTDARTPVEDLDSLPQPAWNLFPVSKYSMGEKLGFEFPLRTMNIISGRGCPYRCSYCFHGIFGYKYRARSARKVVDEVMYLKNKYNINGILFSDDTFTLKKEWVKEFCGLLQNSRLNIKWACNGRVNTVSPDMLSLMKEAGCCKIFYGIESGSQRILNTINKGSNIEQAAQAIMWSRDAGLEVGGYFIIGSPGETSETVKETVNFCINNDMPLGLNIATPMPGTRWLEQAVSKGKVSNVSQLVSRWSCWTENVVVNLSDLSDKELLDLKVHAEQLVRQSRNGNNGLTADIRQLSTFIEYYGISMLAKKIGCKILRSLGVSMEPYTKMQQQARKSRDVWADIISGRNQHSYSS